MDIKTTLVREVIPVREAELLASIVGADVNDLFFNEPTMADYQIITAPLPPLPPDATAAQVEERTKVEASRDAFSVMAVIKDGAGKKVVETKHIEQLPSTIGAKLINIASAITLAVIRAGAEGGRDAIKKIAPTPSGDKTPPPNSNST